MNSATMLFSYMDWAHMMKKEIWRSVEDENKNGSLIVSLDLARRSLLSTKVLLKATEFSKPEQDEKLG